MELSLIETPFVLSWGHFMWFHWHVWMFGLSCLYCLSCN